MFSSYPHTYETRSESVHTRERGWGDTSLALTFYKQSLSTSLNCKHYCLTIKVPKLFRKTPQKRGGLPHSVLRTLRLTLSFVADRQANNDRKKELKKGQASTPKKNNKRSVFMASVTFEKSSFARSGKNSSVFSDNR